MAKTDLQIALKAMNSKGYNYFKNNVPYKAAQQKIETDKLNEIFDSYDRAYDSAFGYGTTLATSSSVDKAEKAILEIYSHLPGMDTLEKAQARLEADKIIAGTFGISLDEAMKKSSMYKRAMVGTDLDDKSFIKALKDSWDSYSLQRDLAINQLAIDYSNDEIANKKRREKQEEIKYNLIKLGDYNVDRGGLAFTAIKSASIARQMVPTVVIGLATAGAGWLAGAGVIGASLGTVQGIGKAAAIGNAMYNVFAVEAGSASYEMENMFNENGQQIPIDKTTRKVASIVIGAVNTAIEFKLDPILGSFFKKGVGQDILIKAGKELAIDLIKKYGASVLGESFEEALQTATSEAGKLIAANISTGDKAKYGLTDENINKVVSEAMQSFIDTVGPMALLGVPTTAVKSSINFVFNDKYVKEAGENFEQPSNSGTVDIKDIPNSNIKPTVSDLKNIGMHQVMEEGETVEEYTDVDIDNEDSPTDFSFDIGVEERESGVQEKEAKAQKTELKTQENEAKAPVGESKTQERETETQQDKASEAKAPEGKKANIKDGSRFVYTDPTTGVQYQMNEGTKLRTIKLVEKQKGLYSHADNESALISAIARNAGIDYVSVEFVSPDEAQSVTHRNNNAYSIDVSFLRRFGNKGVSYHYADSISSNKKTLTYNNNLRLEAALDNLVNMNVVKEWKDTKKSRTHNRNIEVTFDINGKDQIWTMEVKNTPKKASSKKDGEILQDVVNSEAGAQETVSEKELEERNYAKEKIGTLFSEKEEDNDVIASSITRIAKRFGMDTKSFLDKYLDFRDADNETVKRSRGYITLGNIKRVIYAGDYADVTTFFHEMTHFLMSFEETQKEFMSLMKRLRRDKQTTAFVKQNADIFDENIDIERLFSDNSTYGEAQDEFCASMLEAYITRGVALKDSGIKALMRKLARAFREVYSHIRRTAYLHPDIMAFYDGLFGFGDGSVNNSSKLSTATSSKETIRYQKEISTPEQVQQGVVAESPTARPNNSGIQITEEQAVIWHDKGFPIASATLTNLIREADKRGDTEASEMLKAIEEDSEALKQSGLIEDASTFKSKKEFFNAFKDVATMDMLTKAWMHSKIQTPEEMRRGFIKEFSTRKGLLWLSKNLSGRLSTYVKEDGSIGQRMIINEAPLVNEYLVGLSEKSPAEDFDKAAFSIRTETKAWVALYNRAMRGYDALNGNANIDTIGYREYLNSFNSDEFFINSIQVQPDLNSDWASEYGSSEIETLKAKIGELSDFEGIEFSEEELNDISMNDIATASLSIQKALQTRYDNAKKESDSKIKALETEISEQKKRLKEEKDEAVKAEHERSIDEKEELIAELKSEMRDKLSDLKEEYEKKIKFIKYKRDLENLEIELKKRIAKQLKFNIKTQDAMFIPIYQWLAQVAGYTPQLAQNISDPSALTDVDAIDENSYTITNDNGMTFTVFSEEQLTKGITLTEEMEKNFLYGADVTSTVDQEERLRTIKRLVARAEEIKQKNQEEKLGISYRIAMYDAIYEALRVLKTESRRRMDLRNATKKARLAEFLNGMMQSLSSEWNDDVYQRASKDYFNTLVEKYEKKGVKNAELKAQRDFNKLPNKRATILRYAFSNWRTNGYIQYSEQKEKTGLFRALDVAKMAIEKPQRLMEELDTMNRESTKDTESLPFMQFFVRIPYECQNEETKNINRRQSEIKKKFKEIYGYEMSSNKRVGNFEEKFNVPLASSARTDKTVELTRAQIMQVYIYSLQGEGAKSISLMMDVEKGNGISLDFIEALRNETERSYDKDGKALESGILSEKDREFARYLQEDISSRFDDTARILYETENKVLMKTNKYFPLRGEGMGLHTISADGLIQKSKDSNLNKRHTKNRTEEIYKLNLDLMNNVNSAIRAQEHYIAYAKWIADAKYLFNHARLGQAVSDLAGKTNSDMLIDYVNRIIAKKNSLDAIENSMKAVLSNMSAAKVAGSILSIAKQFISLIPGMTMNGVGRYAAQGIAYAFSKTGLEAIKEMDASIADRNINLDVVRYYNLNSKHKVTNTIRNITQMSLSGMQVVDQKIAASVWYAAYLKYKDTHADSATLEEDARFFAALVVSKTQSTSNDITSLSAWQASNSFTARVMNMFTQDLYQMWNRIWFDDVNKIKHHEYLSGAGDAIVVTLLTGLAGAILQFGFLPDEDEDEEDKAFDINTFMQDFAEEWIQMVFPYIGNVFSDVIRGYSSNSGLSSQIISDFWALYKQYEITDEEQKALDKKKKKKAEKWMKQRNTRMADNAFDVIVDLFELAGAPAQLMKRIKKSVVYTKNGEVEFKINPAYLLNSAAGDFVNRVFLTE